MSNEKKDWEQELSEEIKKISSIFKGLENSQLSRRTIILILSDCTGFTKTEVKTFLDNIRHLERIYLK